MPGDTTDKIQLSQAAGAYASHKSGHMAPEREILHVEVSPKLKADAESLFEDLGLTINGAITLFLQAALNQDGMPFEIKRQMPNANTRAAMVEYSTMQDNPGHYRRYSTVNTVIDEALDDLL